MAFGILGLLFGITRGMTKDKDMWALIFSSFAWLIALIVPNTIFAATIFLAGAIGITLAYMPVIKELAESNIFIVAAIALIVNISLLFGAGIFYQSVGWGTNLDNARAGIMNVTYNVSSESGDIMVEHGLCARGSTVRGECNPTPLEGVFNSVVFDVFASILAIGTYITKAITLAGMAVLAPIIIAQTFSTLIANTFVGYLIAIYIVFWNLAIIYNIIKFILNKRGM